MRRICLGLCLENVSRTLRCPSPTTRVAVRSLVPPLPPLRRSRSTISVSLARVSRAPSRSLPCSALRVFSSLSAVSTFFLSAGEKRTETRCRPCRPDCACFLAETRHNASSYRTPTMTNVPWRGHRPRWLFNHDARCNFTPRTVAAEALNHCGPLSIRCLPRMGRECSCTLSLKHVS